MHAQHRQQHTHEHRPLRDEQMTLEHINRERVMGCQLHQHSTIPPPLLLPNAGHHAYDGDKPCVVDVGWVTVEVLRIQHLQHDMQ